MPTIQVAEANVAQYELEIEINASRERVWLCLTDQLGSWWLPDFHMLGPESLVTLEPFPGGRLYEENGKRGLLWYTVLAIAPDESLSLVGYCTPEFGGPSTTMLTIKLEARSESTVVRVTDAIYGRATEGQATSLQSGWQQLFTDGLKAFVEAA